MAQREQSLSPHITQHGLSYFLPKSRASALIAILCCLPTILHLCSLKATKFTLEWPSPSGSCIPPLCGLHGGSHLCCIWVFTLIPGEGGTC